MRTCTLACLVADVKVAAGGGVLRHAWGLQEYLFHRLVVAAWERLDRVMTDGGRNGAYRRIDGVQSLIEGVRCRGDRIDRRCSWRRWCGRSRWARGGAHLHGHRRWTRGGAHLRGFGLRHFWEFTQYGTGLSEETLPSRQVTCYRSLLNIHRPSRARLPATSSGSTKRSRSLRRWFGSSSKIRRTLYLRAESGGSVRMASET